MNDGRPEGTDFLRLPPIDVRAGLSDVAIGVLAH
jgi:hypothetical protein